MLRRTLAALLLSSLALTAQADDPALPVLPGPTLGPTPIAEPTPITGSHGSTSTYSGSISSQPVQSGTVYSGSTYSNSGDNYSEYSGTQSTIIHSTPSYEQPTYEQPSYSSGVEYSAPVMSQSVDLGYAQPAASNCNCQNGAAGYSSVVSGLSTYGGGFAGGTVDMTGGYQAMGYHGGGMETYTGATGGGLHVRHPYYSYRRPWYANGPMSQNVTIAW